MKNPVQILSARPVFFLLVSAMLTGMSSGAQAQNVLTLHNFSKTFGAASTNADGAKPYGTLLILGDLILLKSIQFFRELCP